MANPKMTEEEFTEKTKDKPLTPADIYVLRSDLELPAERPMGIQPISEMDAASLKALRMRAWAKLA